MCYRNTSECCMC